MALDLVRLIARRNVHGHEKKKESIQPPPMPEWMPVPGAASGTPTGVPASVSEGTDADEAGIGSILWRAR